MRGTPGLVNCRRCRRGIIPAYAGNTSLLLELSAVARDHPRVCGEHLEQVARRVGQEGSSPRMRGTPSFQPVGTEYKGIIPAYAGNTLCANDCVTDSRDHPRVCGEHRVAEKGHQTPPGIIPAYAGNTPSQENTRLLKWDHPRVCGEHWLLRQAASCRAGSSPRMRGTPRALPPYGTR